MRIAEMEECLMFSPSPRGGVLGPLLFISEWVLCRLLHNHSKDLVEMAENNLLCDADHDTLLPHSLFLLLVGVNLSLNH